MKNLVIVESPTKARTISRFLGKDYEIKSSMGHVLDLPKSKIGVDIDKQFKPDLEILSDKKAVLSDIRKSAKDSMHVLLATDPDREGEAISSNIRDLLTQGKDKISKNKFKRIVFHEITEYAIKEALKNPRDVDENLVTAQTARRVLDRLVGYQLSPVLWKKVRRGLSAGRVQSVALRLLVEREKEIEKFAKDPYWSIHAFFNGSARAEKSESTEFLLVEINNEKVDIQEKLELYDGEYTFSRTIIDSEEKADGIIEDVKSYKYQISDVSTRETKRSPYPPFTTSTLQQASAIRFGFPGKRTMGLAQKLYEEGYITYHRTDSVTLSAQAVKQMREYIVKEYGEKYTPGKPRFYFSKQKNAQEAHEAIRPTLISHQSSAVSSQLGEAYGKLYDLIWKRAVASQMSDSLIESTTVFADSGNSSQLPVNQEAVDQTSNQITKYRFKATGSVLLFDGFLILTPQALDDRQLPQFIKDQLLDLKDTFPEGHETTPPPRYNDASLIKTLEEKGIGRPSTYASIISTLTDRGYVEREEKKFIPTSVGSAVNDFLVTNFSTIDDIPFTALMEEDLDLVANGEKKYEEMMSEFYTPFAVTLKKVENAERVQIPVEETDEDCPECKKGKLVIRTGRFGKFYSCNRFPECRYTKQFVQETNLNCPKDEGKIIVRKTRKGRKFYGCSNYPACQFAAWKLSDITK